MKSVLLVTCICWSPKKGNCQWTMETSSPVSCWCFLKRAIEIIFVCKSALHKWKTRLSPCWHLPFGTMNQKIKVQEFHFYWDELTRHIAAYASFNGLSHLGTRKHRDREGRAGREKDSEVTTPCTNLSFLHSRKLTWIPKSWISQSWLYSIYLWDQSIRLGKLDESNLCYRLWFFPTI